MVLAAVEVEVPVEVPVEVEVEAVFWGLGSGPAADFLLTDLLLSPLVCCCWWWWGSLGCLEPKNLSPANVDLMLLAMDFLPLLFLPPVAAEETLLSLLLTTAELTEEGWRKLTSLMALSSPHLCHTLLTSAGRAKDSLRLSSAARKEHMERQVSSALGSCRVTSPPWDGRCFRRHVLLSMTLDDAWRLPSLSFAAAADDDDASSSRESTEQAILPSSSSAPGSPLSGSSSMM